MQFQENLNVHESGEARWPRIKECILRKNAATEFIFLSLMWVICLAVNVEGTM